MTLGELHDDAQIAFGGAALPEVCSDRRGNVAWHLHWHRGALQRAMIRLPAGDAIELVARATEHPLLGACDLLRTTTGTALARVASIDWAAPSTIPAVDVPGALPPGAGTAVLNLLARLAAHAGVESLRYRGPYPTASLLATLAASFAVPAHADDAFARAAASASFGTGPCEPDVGFTPAPHAWSWTAPRVCAELRDGLQRAWIDGRAFDRNAAHARLVDEAQHHVARVVFAGTTWCDVATIDRNGEPRASIAAPPRVRDDLIGAALPDASAEVLARAIAATAAAPLQRDIVAIVGGGLRLADLGLDPARLVDDRIEVHAELVARALELDPAGSLGTLVAAIAPVAIRAAASRLARRWDALVAGAP